jgi:DNA-binding response OmpR family regulator
VARIALLSPDLLFGSKVEGGLRAAGHTVNRFDTEDSVRPAAAFHDLLVLDLTAEGLDAPALVRDMREKGQLEAVPTLGFYSHVDQETRARAEAAGVSRVVPRSRMAREMAELVKGLLPPT